MRERHVNMLTNSLETTAVGIILMINRSAIKDDPHNHVVHAVHAFGGVNWVAILITAGVIGIILSLFQVEKWHLDAVILSVYGGLWLAYFVAFLVQDLHFRGGGQIQVGTVLSFFVFIRVLIDALRYPGRRRR